MASVACDTIEEEPDNTEEPECPTSPGLRPPFNWPRFFEYAKEELLDGGASTADMLSKTLDDAAGGMACAVIDPSAEDFSVLHISFAFAKMVGCNRLRAVGQPWEVMQLPDDKVLNARINGVEVELLYNFFTACSSFDDRGLRPMAVLLLSERSGGERFWSIVNASRVSFEGYPHILLRIDRLNMPPIELLEGLHPTIEVKSRLEELLNDIRESLRARFAQGEGGATMGVLARLAEEAVQTWLQAGNAGGGEKDVENASAPQSGTQAAKLFEDNGVWTSLFRPHEQRIALESEDTAWTVQDLQVDVQPLVYLTPKFAEITGYSREWMLGRNMRFLQPCDPGRNEVFNGEELRRVREFCQGGNGTLTSLLLNQKADGSFFWNLMVMEWVVFQGHSYILAANKQLTLHQELLSMMNTWDHRSLSYISGLRLLLTAREPHLSPMPARSQANEPMIAEVFSEWSENIRQDLSDFWEGDHFVPPIGGLAVETFEGRWAPLLQKSDEMIRKTYAIQEATLSCMRENVIGGIVCCVADPTAPDCPLVFVSKEFESQTAYKREFALGRNCRFLQPNNRQFNIAVNGGEVAGMRHFCTLLSDFPVGTTIINLLLNEKKGGERFWNLLHMVHVDVAGRRYILGVQTVLDLPMPAFLKTAARDLHNLPSDEKHKVQDMCSFLAKLRSHLRDLSKTDEPNMKELSKSMNAEILEYIKTATDDFEGDHYVPRVGLAQARQFEHDRKWAHVFSEVGEDMKEIFEATEETYAKTKVDCKGSACCTVADPGSQDCPLLYISTGFENLTGYHRDWALGRNCRFLQPNGRSYNDAFNSWERGQMREFCQMPPKNYRQLTLLVNEHRDGYPFWNALVMKHVTVAGHDYIFGVQTNVLNHLEILGELLAGGPDGFRELGRLRAIVRSKSAKLGAFSLATLLDDCLGQWISTLPIYINPLHIHLPLDPRVRLPAFGLELARNEQQSLEDKVLAALDEGIRHFHLNFAIKSASQTMDVEGRLFALRVVEALAVLKQRHLHYLRDCIIFSLRSKPSQLAGSLEILNFLQSAGFKASLWLLDVSSASCNDISGVWPDLDDAVRHKLVQSVGLYGGGAAEFAAACDQDLVNPTVQALDIYVGVQFNCRQWVHVSKLSQAGVVVMTCKPFGLRGSLLSNPQIRTAAHELGIDPALLLLKWAEGLGYLCVTPMLGSTPFSRDKLSNDLPFVLNGTRRTFVKAYAAGPSASQAVATIKRRFPTLSLDHVRSHATHTYSGGGADSNPVSPTGRGVAFGSSQRLRPSTKPAAAKPKPRAAPALYNSAPSTPQRPLTSKMTRPSGSPQRLSGSPSSPGLTRSPMSTGSLSLSQRKPPGSGGPNRGTQHRRSSDPSTPTSPGSNPGSPASPSSASGSRSSPQKFRTSSPPPQRLQRDRQTSPSPVPRIVLDRTSIDSPSSKVEKQRTSSAELAENTDSSERTEMQRKQQELAKREVEVMLRELQLEQRLLKEEHRLLSEKSTSGYPES